MKRKFLVLWVVMLILTACAPENPNTSFHGTYAPHQDGVMYEYLSIDELDSTYFYRTAELDGYAGSLNVLDEDIILFLDGPLEGQLVLLDDNKQIRLIDPVDTKRVTIYYKRSNICHQSGNLSSDDQ